MARRLDDDGTLMMTLMFRCWLTLGALPAVQTRDVASEAVLLARRTHNDQALLEMLFWRMFGQLVLGEVALAERDLAEYSALAERLRHVLHSYWAEVFRAMRCEWSGDFATAARLSDAACARGLRIQEPLAVEMHALQRWNASALQGKGFAQSGSLLRDYEGSLAGRAREIEHGMACGDLARARSTYEALAHSDFADIPLSPIRLSVLAVLATSCARFDDRPRAQSLYALLLPYAELNVVSAATWIYLGPVAEYLGQLANCLGDHTLAAEHFARALAECSKFGARPQLARVRFQYAHTLRALPDTSPDLVSELLRQVAAAADELGTARSFALPLHARLNHKDEI
jgi:tetratricopeptide (TPR) repeat protein